MEDWIDPSPLHCLDVIVYENNHFNLFRDEGDFLNEFPQQRHQNISEIFSTSIGSLLRGEAPCGTAFVVNIPSFKVEFDGKAVKAFLLTAAHVFENPLEIEHNDNMLFTLAPKITQDILLTYTTFQVKRILKNIPFSSGKPQSDPITKYPYMFPDDVELLAILEGDSGTTLRTQGNKLNALPYRPANPNHPEYFLIGYPGLLPPKNLATWVPILAKRQDLEPQVSTMTERHEIKKLFAPGRLKKMNESCLAISCSGFSGMSGGPVCFQDGNDGEVFFCGLYNGSAALPFQFFFSKVLAAIKGYPINLTEFDYPSRNLNTVKETLFYASVFYEFIKQTSSLTFDQFLDNMSCLVRGTLNLAAKYEMPVEHNLALIGGESFEAIIAGLKKMEATEKSNECKINDFFNMKKSIYQISTGKDICKKRYWFVHDSLSESPSEVQSLLKRYFRTHDCWEGTKSEGDDLIKKEFETIEANIKNYMGQLGKILAVLETKKFKEETEIKEKKMEEKKLKRKLRSQSPPVFLRASHQQFPKT